MATMVLADFGADVVKVEAPGGDRFRSLAAAPLWLRGKRSVTADLATADGLARAARPRRSRPTCSSSRDRRRGPAAGASTPTPRSALRPDLVHCSITGWGPTGPLAEVPGYEAAVARSRWADARVRAPAAPRRAGVRGRAGRRSRRRPRRRAGHRRRAVRPGSRRRRPAGRDEPAAGAAAVRPRRAAARRDGRAQRARGAEHPRRRRRPADAQLPPGADRRRTLDPVRQPARAPADGVPRRHRPAR